MKWILLLLSVVLAGCVSIAPEPLNYEQSAHGFSAETAPTSLDFEQAVARFLSANQQLKQWALEAEKWQGFAKIEQPLPNPVVGAGFKYGSDLDGADATDTQPFLSLAFAIPMSERLARANDLTAAEANVALVTLENQAKALFLRLRHQYQHAYLLQQQVTEQLALIAATESVAQEALALGQRGILAESEALFWQRQLLEQCQVMSQLRNEKRQITAELATLLHWRGLEQTELTGPLVWQLPAVAVVNAQMDGFSPKLNALRANYAQSEAALALALEKQYPDLSLSTGFDKEPGEDKKLFALGISLELPIFDRNQQEIAKRVTERAVARGAFELAVTEELAQRDALMAALTDYQVLSQQHQAESLPLAEQMARLAKKQFRAGVISWRDWKLADLDQIRQKSVWSALDRLRWQTLAELENLAGFPVADPQLGEVRWQELKVEKNLQK